LRPCFKLLQFAKASRYFVAAVKAFHADQPLTTQKDLYGLSRAI
jgi:molybdopterin-guanine dinucleotide biosynthesis protein